MKVIGIVTDKSTILVEMSTTELANIGGRLYNSRTMQLTDASGTDYEADARDVKVGDVMSVEPLYQRAREIVDAHDAMKGTLSQVKGVITTYQNAVKTRGDA